MPLQETSGNVTTDAYGGGVAAVPNYIEDVFSTYLYTGNSSTQTITNGIDLSTKGGLVWIKNRNDVYEHQLTDTSRGVASQLKTESTAAETTEVNRLTSFNSSGFSMSSSARVNASGYTYASWTFREQPKFFDVVTYTGDGTSNRAIAHSLGATPGSYFIKATSVASNWYVYHRGAAGTDPTYITKSGRLNSTDAFTGYAADGLLPSSTNIYVVKTGDDLTGTNNSGVTYVAYLFAHNAGGFGLTGTDNVISCGSYVGSDTTFTTVTLGYEPQWVMIKRATGFTSAYTGWAIFDNMRGMPVSGNDNTLLANTSDAENPATANNSFVSPTATGFTLNVPGSNLTNTSDTYIYIAIRRGPMKVPTSGTSVFSPNATTAAVNTKITTNFPVDLQMQGYRPGFSGNIRTIDRLRGTGTIPSSTSTTVPQIATSSAAAEANASAANGWDNTGFQIPSSWNGDNMVYWNFKRAPSFFDEVCYSGTSANRTVAHNLGVAPELILIKIRNEASGWRVYASPLTATSYLILNQTNESSTSSTTWNNTTPTSSVFSLGTDASVNGPYNYVAYLFATCAGVSKVGSYTGNGSTQTINCGFTGGARFVLIKRTDSTGDWYVYDTARGMTTLTDPYLLLNSTAAESATLGSVTTVSTGFAVNASILAAINTNAASYIFLAIA